MPLIKRGIEPVNLSRTHVAPGIQNELECVTNNTLASVIRQLSSLSKHAEDMFCELYNDTSVFFHRANQLQERVDRLKIKVTQLDSTVEEVSLQDINMRKPFKSSVWKDQQIVTLKSRPAAIQETYLQCDAPPALDKLNAYREDGKDSMKFYTDPQYFFDLWCMEMQKDTEQTKKELKKRKGKRGPNKKQPTAIREIHSKNKELQKMKLGPEFAEIERPSQPQRRPNQDNNRFERSPSRPSSLEIQNMEHLAQHGHYNGGYPPGQNPPGPSEQYPYQHANGPVLRQSSHEEARYGQPPPPYSQDHQQPPPYSAAPYNQAGQRAQPEMSPQQTPTKRGGGTPGSRGGSVVSSPRPAQAPPPPPGVVDPMGTRSSSASRESLPPPPPPPPLDDGPVAQGTPPHSSPQSTPHMAHINNKMGGSPARSTPSPGGFTNSSTPNSVDLPPPPPPPPDMINTPYSMASPPPTPPPPEPLDHAPPPQPMAGGAPPPPPPPPPSLGLGKDAMPKKAIPNGNVPQVGDTTSLASNGSSNTSGSGRAEAEGGAPVRDNRSDLLHAIREGFQLRRVEERRQKAEDKRPSGRLDVQSIMEAAFEMRRKALEANDSDDEESDEGDGAWDSDDN